MSNPKFRVPYLSLCMPGENRRSYELGRVIAKATSRQRVGYVAEYDLCRLIVTDNGCFRRPTSAWETINREYKRTYYPDDLSIYFA